MGDGEGAHRPGGVREGAPHAALNISKWTKEALLDIGIDSATLIGLIARCRSGHTKNVQNVFIECLNVYNVLFKGLSV